ncbi:hypothetical protein K438DRAFT_1601931 [Mycena galopus ATCC 62051]|nr:hypothetical protein K438DRAFT_1601931 [Mycena galopus ATCC 62051]
MKFLALLAATTPFLGAVLADSWGPAYSLGPTTGAVIGTTYTFTSGTPPQPPTDFLFLWVGVSNGTSGLIQAGANQYENMESACGATNEEWCVGASYFGVVNGETTQLNGPMVTVSGSTPVFVDYSLSGNTWTQTVEVGGKVVSTLTSEDGPLLKGGWGTGTEIDSNSFGTTSAQTYTDITILLSEADPNFKNTLGMGAGVVATPMETTDGGKTWTIASILLPATDPTSTTTTIKSTTTTTSAPSGPTGGGTVAEYGQC